MCLSDGVHLGMVGADQRTVDVRASLREFNCPLEQGIMTDTRKVFPRDGLRSAADGNDRSQGLTFDHTVTLFDRRNRCQPIRSMIPRGAIHASTVRFP
jgi:hypothetical protein